MSKLNLIRSSLQMEMLGGSVARRCLQHYSPGVRGVCVLLCGAVGVGKSVFARGFVRDIINSPKEIVPSPSFLLEQTYSGVREPSGSFTVRHFDLYRLQNNITAADWEALGMREALQNDLCLVEWPEVAEGMFQESKSDTKFVSVKISLNPMNENGEEDRHVTIDGLD